MKVSADISDSVEMRMLPLTRCHSPPAGQLFSDSVEDDSVDDPAYSVHLRPDFVVKDESGLYIGFIMRFEQGNPLEEAASEKITIIVT